MSVRGILAVVFVVALAGCGVADGSSTMDAPETAPSTDGPLASVLVGTSVADQPLTAVPVTTMSSQPVPIETLEPPASDPSVPSPEQVRWLAPSGEVAGLRLIEARRELVAGCGPMGDCALTVPGATLTFDTDDLAIGRSMSVSQTLGAPYEKPAPSGELRIVGSREVVVDEPGAPDSSSIAAVWSEPGGIEVEVQATNVPWGDVEAFIASLQPLDPAVWPGIEAEGPLERCLGERSQFGPAGVPEGWIRVVLEAAPIGGCNVDTFLFMSLVIPGTVDEPGTLVTFVSSPASTAGIATGEPVDINGVTAHLEESEQADGSPFSSIEMQVGDAFIRMHGNVDPATLIELVETVRLLNDDEWSQLVAEIDAG